MIDPKTLMPGDINRKVVYRPRNRQEREDGRITSWNERFIFVDYTNAGRGQATSPEDLEFL